MLNITELQKHLDAVANTEKSFDQKAKLLHLAMKALEMSNLNDASINLEESFTEDVNRRWLINTKTSTEFLISHLENSLHYLSPKYKNKPFEEDKKRILEELQNKNQEITKIQIAIEEYQAELLVLNNKTQELTHSKQNLLQIENELKYHQQNFKALASKMNQLDDAVSLISGDEFLILSNQFIENANKVSAELHLEHQSQHEILNTLDQKLNHIKQSKQEINQKQDVVSQAKNQLTAENQNLLNAQSTLKQTEQEYQQLQHKVDELKNIYSDVTARQFVELSQSFEKISAGLFKFFENNSEKYLKSLDELNQKITIMNQDILDYQQKTNELNATHEKLLNTEQSLKQIEQTFNALEQLINHLLLIKDKFTPEFLQERFNELKNQENIILNDFLGVNNELIQQIQDGLRIIEQQYEMNHTVIISMQQDLVLFDTNRQFKNPSFELSQIREEENQLKNTIQSIENRIKLLLNQRDEMRRLILQKSNI